REAYRRLCAGRRPIREFGRAAAVPGIQRRGCRAASADGGTCRAETAEAGRAARPGDDLPEVPGEGTAATLRQRRSVAGGFARVPGRRANPGTAGENVGAGSEVGAPAPGRGGALHRGRSGSVRAPWVGDLVRREAAGTHEGPAKRSQPGRVSRTTVA